MLASTSARSWSSRAPSGVGDRGVDRGVEAGDGGAESGDLLGQRSERRGHPGVGRRAGGLGEVGADAVGDRGPRGVDGGGDAGVDVAEAVAHGGAGEPGELVLHAGGGGLHGAGHRWRRGAAPPR